jgi:hypothetical protein
LKIRETRSFSPNGKHTPAQWLRKVIRERKPRYMEYRETNASKRKSGRSHESTTLDFRSALEGLSVSALFSTKSFLRSIVQRSTPTHSTSLPPRSALYFIYDNSLHALADRAEFSRSTVHCELRNSWLIVVFCSHDQIIRFDRSIH